MDAELKVTTKTSEHSAFQTDIKLLLAILFYTKTIVCNFKGSL